MTPTTSATNGSSPGQGELEGETATRSRVTRSRARLTPRGDCDARPSHASDARS
jgi:hypothetical protein